jgi:hypothetical protein
MDRSAAGGESVATSPDALNALVAGALMVYCAGCMMRVSAGKDGAEQMRRLTAQLSNCFAGRPFLAYHPFGEQGFYPSKEINHQANLMFSAVVFTKDPNFEFDETRNFDDMITPILKKFSSTAQSDLVNETLLGLLQLCDACDFADLGQLLQLKEMSPNLLRDALTCAGRPVNFALATAEMYYRLQFKDPLKAHMYRAEAGWYKQFLMDFMTGSGWPALQKAKVLDEETIFNAVRLAGLIGSGGFVATQPFQELMELMWVYDLSIDGATDMLAGMEGAGGGGGVVKKNKCRLSAKYRFVLNTSSLMLLAMIQYITSQHYTDSVMMWGVCLCFSGSHLFQLLAAPNTGFYQAVHILDDIFIVSAHVMIFYRVFSGSDVPRDLDALTMLLHFLNITKNMVVQPQIGSLVITLMSMVTGVGAVTVLLAFYSLGFFASLSALYRGLTPLKFGTEWSVSTLLVGVLGSSSCLWQVEADPSKTLFISDIFGITDSDGVNTAGSVVIIFATLTLPILLLNLMIAVMSSSYAAVQEDVDTEMKVQFAACTMQARTLAQLPMPFSILVDIVRVFRKIVWGDPDGTSSGSMLGAVMGGNKRVTAISRITAEEIVNKQIGTLSLITQWEVRTQIAKLKSVANVEQIERMRIQSDHLQDRVQVLYNCLLDTKDIVSSLTQ